MKTIYLVRHGSAVEKSDDIQDISRNLTESGIEEVKYIAKNMRDAAEYPDIMISSPASRALESAKIIAGKLRYPEQKIEIENLLYESKEPQALVQFLAKVSPGLTSVCLVGHNPLLTELAKTLCKSFATDIPKGGIVALEFSADSWDRIREGAGKAIFADFPGCEKDIRTQLEDKLIPEIYENLAEFFSKRHGEVIKHLRTPLLKSAGRLAGKYLKLVRKKTGKIRKGKWWAGE